MLWLFLRWLTESLSCTFSRIAIWYVLGCQFTILYVQESILYVQGNWNAILYVQGNQMLSST